MNPVRQNPGPCTRLSSIDGPRYHKYQRFAEPINVAKRALHGILANPCQGMSTTASFHAMRASEAGLRLSRAEAGLGILVEAEGGRRGEVEQADKVGHKNEVDRENMQSWLVSGIGHSHFV